MLRDSLCWLSHVAFLPHCVPALQSHAADPGVHGPQGARVGTIKLLWSELLTRPCSECAQFARNAENCTEQVDHSGLVLPSYTARSWDKQRQATQQGFMPSLPKLSGASPWGDPAWNWCDWDGPFSIKYPQPYKEVPLWPSIPGAWWHASHHSSQAALRKNLDTIWENCW